MTSQLSIRFTGLDHHVLVRVSDTFAFVGLRFFESADTGSNFTDQLFVNTFNEDLHTVSDSHFDSVGNHVHAVVGVTQTQSKFLAGKHCFITDTDDLKFFFVTFSNTNDHVFDHAAVESVEGFVDPFGGYLDLKNNVLRAVGEPETRFKEDALRILRGVRFAVRFGLTPEEKTLEAMNSCTPLLENLAQERVSSELCKLLPLISTEQLMQYKTIITQVIPALTPEEGEDHYDKIAAVIGHLEQDLPLRMAALLLPLGEEEADATLQQLRCSNALRNRVLLLIRLSAAPLTADRKQLFQLLGEHGQEAVEQLLSLQLAIATVSGDDLTELEAVAPVLQELCTEGKCLTPKDLVITGTDLLELGVAPGPIIGQCMQLLLSLVQDEILPNQREDLLAAAKNFFEAEEEA